MTFDAVTHAAVRRAANALVDGNALLWDRPGLQSSLHRNLVIVGETAAALLDLERRARTELQPRSSTLAAPSFAASDRVGSTARAIVDSIDFPGFVENLITGVFQAIWRSNIQQLEAIAQLLDAVSKTSTEFAATEITDGQAVDWLVKAVPGLVSKSGGTRASLGLQGGVEFATIKPELGRALGVDDRQLDSVGAASLDKLIPMARLKIGKGRQQNLATLVMMGLNRIVVDKGQLHAEMDMRVDARSAARSASHSGINNQDGIGVNAGAGGQGWGAAAGITASVAVIKDNQTQTSEELAAEGSLRSSVDVIFHTEPIQLSQMASMKLREQIIQNSRVPDAQWSQDNLAKSYIGDLQNEVQAAPAPTAPDAAQFMQQAAQGGAPGGDGMTPGGAGEPGAQDGAGGPAGEAPEGGAAGEEAGEAGKEAGEAGEAGKEAGEAGKEAGEASKAAGEAGEASKVAGEAGEASKAAGEAGEASKAAGEAGKLGELGAVAEEAAPLAALAELSTGGYRMLPMERWH